MRPLAVLRLAVAAALLFSFGCSSNNKGKIEGSRWKSQAANVKGAALPPGALSLDFNKDGSLNYKVGPQTFTGTFSLGMGNTVNFHFNQEVQGRKVHAEKIVINGEQLTMTDSDGTSLTFDRIK